MPENDSRIHYGAISSCYEFQEVRGGVAIVSARQSVLSVSEDIQIPSILDGRKVVEISENAAPRSEVLGFRDALRACASVDQDKDVRDPGSTSVFSKKAPQTARYDRLYL